MAMIELSIIVLFVPVIIFLVKTQIEVFMFHPMFFVLLLVNLSFLFVVSYLSKKMAKKKVTKKKTKTKRIYVKFTLPKES